MQRPRGNTVSTGFGSRPLEQSWPGQVRPVNEAHGTGLHIKAWTPRAAGSPEGI